MAEPTGLDAFMRAIGGQESGDNPTAENDRTGAYGTYQILPSNWPSWAAEAGLGRNAPRTAENQYRVARFKMAQYYRQFGSWQAVAVAWYAGPGAAQAYVQNPNQTRFTRGQGPNGTEPSIQSYVNIAMRGMGQSAKAPAGAVPPVGGEAPAGGAMAPAAAGPKSRAETLDYIAENYPDYYAVMAINPEVKELLLTAAEKEYSQAKLRSELFKTDWWKNTSATARTWDANYAQDRATGDQLLRQTEQRIGTEAARIGVTLSPAQVSKMAVNYHRFGWSDMQVSQALAAQFRQRSAKAGAGTATVDSLRALAADYGVTVSDHTLTVWTQRILGGKADPEGFRSYVAKYAQGQYPTIADEIESGMTVREYFDPYVQSAAQLLGLNPEEINLSETKWKRAVNNLVKSGTDGSGNAKYERRPMTLDEWETELRTNSLYGFDRTRNGRQSAADFVGAMMQRVGWQ